MIRRDVEFSLATDGSVTPAVPQYGGVKGEHNVTRLSFTMNTSAVHETGDVMRISFYAGDGTVLSTDLLEDGLVDTSTNHMKVSYLLPQNLTMAGGQLCARLVISRFDASGNEAETFRSGEAVLYFDDAAVENGTPFWTGVSEMLKRTVTAKEAAVQAQEAAESAKDEAKAAADANAQAIADNTAAIGVHQAMLNVVSEKAAEHETAISMHQSMLNVAMQSSAKHEEAIAENKAECDARLTQTAATLHRLMSSKLDKSGHAPNMYLGTDDKGNVVVKIAPSGDSGVELPFTGIGAGLGVENGVLKLATDDLEGILGGLFAGYFDVGDGLKLVDGLLSLDLDAWQGGEY